MQSFAQSIVETVRHPLLILAATCASTMRTPPSAAPLPSPRRKRMAALSASWAVAIKLQATARSSDTVARYGGEKFAIILPDTDFSGAMVVAERFRRAVAGKAGNKQGVTVSVGVATLTPATTHAALLVRAAGRGRYHSKRADRNRLSHGSWATAMLTASP